MFKDAGIGALCFIVRDPARTATFYRDVLGLETQHFSEEEGGFVMARTGSTMLLAFAGNDPAGRSPIVVFALPDGGIEDYVDRLIAMGVPFVVPVSPAPDGGLTADFTDPDQHVFSLHQDPGLPRRRGKPL